MGSTLGIRVSDVTRRRNAKNNRAYLVVSFRLSNHCHPTPLLQCIANDLQHLLFSAVEAMELAKVRLENEAFEISKMIEDQPAHLPGRLTNFVALFSAFGWLWIGNIARRRWRYVIRVSAKSSDAACQLCDIAPHD